MGPPHGVGIAVGGTGAGVGVGVATGTEVGVGAGADVGVGIAVAAGTGVGVDGVDGDTMEAIGNRSPAIWMLARSPSWLSTPVQTTLEAGSSGTASRVTVDRGT
jgi:hypothetical protein